MPEASTMICQLWGVLDAFIEWAESHADFDRLSSKDNNKAYAVMQAVIKMICALGEDKAKLYVPHILKFRLANDEVE